MAEQDGVLVLRTQRESYPEPTEGDAGVAVLRSVISLTPLVGGSAE